jgi:lipocalin
MYYIFRRSDDEWLDRTNREGEVEQRLRDTVRNNGGTEADYTVLYHSEKPESGFTPSISDDGEVVFIRSRTSLAREAIKESIAGKLANQGFTPEEIDRLI